MSRRWLVPTAAVVVVLTMLAPMLITGAPGSHGAQAVAPTISGSRVATGAYAGTVVEDGEPSPKEWVRFNVNRRQRVVGFRVRLWLQCYIYPNTYYQLPAVVEMPRASVRNRRIDRTWREQIELEDDVETLRGRVQLTFRKRGSVTGRISVDVANCASRLGDPPYWVPLRARHR